MFIVMFNKGTATALAMVDTRQPSVRNLNALRIFIQLPRYIYNLVFLLLTEVARIGVITLSLVGWSWKALLLYKGIC